MNIVLKRQHRANTNPCSWFIPFICRVTVVMVTHLFTGVLFDLQQVDFQTLFHLTRLLLSGRLLRTQPGDLEETRAAPVHMKEAEKTWFDSHGSVEMVLHDVHFLFFVFEISVGGF